MQSWVWLSNSFNVWEHLNSLSRVYFCKELMICAEKIMSTSDAKVTNRREANGRLPSVKGENKFRVECKEILH